MFLARLNVCEADAYEGDIGTHSGVHKEILLQVYLDCEK